jgi:hypothetical protein
MMTPATPQSLILGEAPKQNQLTTGWAVQGLNLGGGEIFHTLQTSTGAHPAFYMMGVVGKAAGAWHWPPTPV